MRVVRDTDGARAKPGSLGLLVEAGEVRERPVFLGDQGVVMFVEFAVAHALEPGGVQGGAVEVCKCGLVVAAVGHSAD